MTHFVADDGDHRDDRDGTEHVRFDRVRCDQ